MRREPRDIILPLARYFPLKKMVSLSGKNIIFPFYHAVSDDPPAHIRHLYPVKTIKAFRRDLDILLKHFQVLSPSFLQDPYSLKYLKSPCFILSFDDGLREIKEVVAPVLEEKGIPAIFFLNNNFIDNRDLFYRYKISIIIDRLLTSPPDVFLSRKIAGMLQSREHHPEVLAGFLRNLSYARTAVIDRVAHLLNIDFAEYLRKNQPYLNSDEVKELMSKGFYIGAHSFDHPHLADLTEEERMKEIGGSLQDIRNRFDVDYKFFAFPFSDDGVSKSFFSKLYHGKDAPDASFGTSGLKKASGYPHYQRIPLEKSLEDAEKYIKTEYFYFLLKRVLGK